VSVVYPHFEAEAEERGAMLDQLVASSASASATPRPRTVGIVRHRAIAARRHVDSHSADLHGALPD
jgi:hypothetical protein